MEQKERQIEKNRNKKSKGNVKNRKGKMEN